MNIKLDKLRSFVLVADEGNLTRAANRRHTTPSAVSEHLRQLEDHFGLSLFERSARGMKLTPDGKKLVVPARQALMQVGELDELARSLRCEKPTTLTIGLNAPPEYLKVDQLLRTAAHDLPEATLELGTSTSYMVVEQVRSGGMDLGFVYGEYASEQIHSVRLAPIHVCVVGPVGASDTLPENPAERRTLPWIWPSGSCPFSNMMPEIIGCGREQAHVVSSSEDEHTTLSMIRAGLGYGLVEHNLAQHWADRGSIKLYDTPVVTISLNLLVRRDRMEQRAVAAVVKLIRQLWQEETITEPVLAGAES